MRYSSKRVVPPSTWTMRDRATWPDDPHKRSNLKKKGYFNRKLPANLCKQIPWERGRATEQIRHRIYNALGFGGPDGRGSVVPKDFHGLFNIDGHDVVVFRGGDRSNLKRKMLGGKGSNKSFTLSRIFFRLKHSGKMVPIGRIRQIKECREPGAFLEGWGGGGSRKGGLAGYDPSTGRCRTRRGRFKKCR
ncbi:MAG: hypothetical protein GY772_23390 [bacterium]|nr:hypothetical protein [bacterium]